MEHSWVIFLMYHPILHTSYLLPQRLFLSFRVRPQTMTLPFPAFTRRRRCGEGKVNYLECVKVWECSARVDQLLYCGACSSDLTGENSQFSNWDVVYVWVRVWVRAEDGEFGELWTRSHKP